MAKFTNDDFIKVGDKYLLKNSNSLLFNEKEKENIIANDKYLTGLMDITSNECQCKKKNVQKVELENEKPNDVDVVKKTTTIKK